MGGELSCPAVRRENLLARVAASASQAALHTPTSHSQHPICWGREGHARGQGMGILGVRICVSEESTGEGGRGILGVRICVLGRGGVSVLVKSHCPSLICPPAHTTSHNQHLAIL